MRLSYPLPTLSFYFGEFSVSFDQTVNIKVAIKYFTSIIIEKYLDMLNGDIKN